MSDFREVSPVTFSFMLEQARKASSLVHKSCPVRDISEYEHSRCFLTADYKTGFSLTSQHEIISLFNVGSQGRGAQAVELAIEEGATRLECPLALVEYYSVLGFNITWVKMSLADRSDG